jgi:hypothetical protein
MKMKIQDDAREKHIIQLFNLKPPSFGKKRESHDAEDEFGNLYEIKTGSTDNYFSTARDVSYDHLKKWRERIWIFIFIDIYADRWNMKDIYICKPETLEPFFKKQQDKLDMKNNILSKLNYGSLDEEERKVVEDVFKRGVTLNDPRISRKFLDSTGGKVAFQEDMPSVLRSMLNKNESTEIQMQ